jgi:hypothetical protein
MMSLPSRHTWQAAMAVVLLLATQLAFAGQLCASVMADGVPVGQQGNLAADAVGMAVAASDLPPCCDGQMPVSTCITAFGGMGLAGLAPGSPSLADLLPLIHDCPPLASRTASAEWLVLSTSSAGPPVPAYIFLRRFLS